MVNTSLGMVDNLVGLIQDFGFVPNGNRRYYLNRSQPPFLPQMVELVYDWLSRHKDTDNNDWHQARMARHTQSTDDHDSRGSIDNSAVDRATQMLQASLPALDREYDWFMR